MEPASKSKDHHYTRANRVLAHTYSYYFFVLLSSVFLDLVFPIDLLPEKILAPLGFSLLGLATLLIIWAEGTHHHRLSEEHVKERGKEALCGGPYCYTRHPTHWGIMLLLLGFGVMLNAFFVIFLTVASFIVSKVTFLKKHDLIMVEKFGEPYEAYKKHVRF